MISDSEYATRFASSFYRMVDATSGYSLNLAAMADYTPEAAANFAPEVARAFDMIRRMEAGEVVNATADARTSENRAVDHYNLRKADSAVAGKSLADSLALWTLVKETVEPIMSGDRVAPCGRPFSAVIFNGIGGSYLGPLMYILSQKGEFYNDNTPVKIYFCANTDPETYRRLIDTVDVATTIMVTISKSGSTQETAGNTQSWCNLLGEAAPAHSIAVTTPGSALDRRARSENWMAVFNMNTETGGRTSVGSAVGMLPAAFARLPFDEFIRGQSHMDELTRVDDLQTNPALAIALAIECQRVASHRRNMIVLCYNDSMREFSHYLQQLYMESLGKEITIDGEAHHDGLTVFGGVGTGEQHAFMQQVQKGIDDAFVRFLHFRERRADFEIPAAGSHGRQLLAFVKGTETALRRNGRSYITSSFARNDSYAIGMAVALEERIVTILSAMRNVNAYDQPGVQDGKLAATSVNELSAEIQTHIPEAAFTAADVATAVNADLDTVEAILLDMAANAGLPGTGYAVAIAAQWTGAHWAFQRL